MDGRSTSPHSGVRLLVSAASRHGGTAEIAEHLGARLRSLGFIVDVVPPEAVSSLEGYDAVVLGSAMYAGRWLRPAMRLARRFRAELQRRPLWLFSSGPLGSTADITAGGKWLGPSELPWLLEALGAIEHRIFAGRLEPSALSGPERFVLRITNVPAGDFREWSMVDAFAIVIATGLRHQAAAA